VHGIDFLPEYEKRRRRLAKLVRGGHQWITQASCACFVTGSGAPDDTLGSSNQSTCKFQRVRSAVVYAKTSH